MKQYELGRVDNKLTGTDRQDHVLSQADALTKNTRIQGTLLDLHGPPNGPLNGPSEANFWGSLVKKGTAGSLHGPN